VQTSDSARGAIHYEHTQRALALALIIALGGVVSLILIVYFRIAHGLPWVFLTGPIVVIAILSLCAFNFSSLTLRVGEAAVEARFGPGWIRKKILLADIASVESVKNPWYYGWGIHYVKRGWVYNISGFEAVELRLKNGSHLRFGTDEPDKLAGVLQQGITGRSSR
jgi:hypothetical protein